MIPAETDVILRNGNFYRRTTQFVDLGSQERILSGFAEQNPVFIRNFQMLGSQPVHLLVNRTSTVIITEITKLPFNSNWQWSDAENAMIPLMNAAMAGSVTIDEPWIAPTQFGKLLFAVALTPQAHGTQLYRNAYLFRYADNELRWFPYPNLFDDCRVCMGRDFERTIGSMPSGTDAMTILLKAQASFYETKMNTDLTKSTTRKMFQRGIDGAWTYHANYSAYSSIASSAFMRGFAL